MKMTVNNRFGILLAEKRIKERRPIPLAEVAESTGISRKTLYAWENNKVNRFDVPVIDALCEYFDIQPGDLFHYVKPLRFEKIVMKKTPTGTDNALDMVEVYSAENTPKKKAATK